MLRHGKHSPFASLDKRPCLDMNKVEITLAVDSWAQGEGVNGARFGSGVERSRFV